jgi:IS1 family transposase
VQCDEKWAFVGKKRRRCDPTDPSDHDKGDCWDHVALDPEHKLVLQVVVGRRDNGSALDLMRAVAGKVPALTTTTPKLGPGPGTKGKRGDKRVLLLATDGYLGYPTSVRLAFGSPPPPDLRYAVVQKRHDEHGRLVGVERHAVCGTGQQLERALAGSPVSTVVNTAFVERHNATDRHRNARKGRRTYRFSKSWRVHEAVTYFTYYTYNFCWCVHTLRRRRPDGAAHEPRTPAMSAGLTDHVWSLTQWLQQVVIGLSG